MDVFELMKLIADLGTAGGLILVMLVLIRREQKQDEADALKNQMQEERQSKEQDTYTSIITHQSEWLVVERERSDRLMKSEQAHRERMAELLAGISSEQMKQSETLDTVRDNQETLAINVQQNTRDMQGGFGLVDAALGEIKHTLEAINRSIDQLNAGIVNHETNARQRYESRALTAERVDELSSRYMDVLTAIRKQVDEVLQKLTTKEVPVVRPINGTEATLSDNPTKKEEETHETDA